MATRGGLLKLSDSVTAETGEDGRYGMPRLEPGSYQVMRFPEGGNVLNLDTRDAAVREGEATVVDFREESEIVVRGSVLRGGQPIPEADLIFVLADEVTSPTGVSTARTG